MSERALITGAAGFVGSHLSKYLIQQGVEIFGLDKPGNTIPNNWPGSWFSENILNSKKIHSILKQIKPDFIFHLAALIKSTSLSELLETNVIGTQSILDAIMEESPDSKILVTGSSSEYGLGNLQQNPISEDTPLNPYSQYGLSKTAQSLLSAQYFYNNHLAIYRTRTFNLTGPGEPDSLVCSAFARQIIEIEQGKRSPILEVGNLKSIRDFLDVRDAVRAYWDVTTKGEPGCVYNVCSGIPVSINNMLAALLQMTNKKIDLRVVNSRKTSRDVPKQIGSYDLIKATTGWHPEIPLEISLRDNLNFWRNIVGAF
jgi:GDP-4-dehydro-6-deoxy-D-mannose reductase